MNSVCVEQFHNDLKAALIAKVPLVAGNNRPLQMEQVDRLSQELQTILVPEQPLTSEVALKIQNQSTLPEWYRAAWVVFIQTGSMVPVLEGLSSRKIAAGSLERALRWTFIHLSIIAIAAILGLAFFYVRSGAAIESLQEDVRLTSGQPETGGFGIVAWIVPVLGVLSLGTAVFISLFSMRGIPRLLQWIGGRVYLDNTTSGTAFRISQTLLRSGMGISDAVPLGLSLTCANEAVRKQVQSLIHDDDEGDVVAQMASYFEHAAHRRLARLQIATPLFLISVFGGGLVALYCLLVFGPIISLLNDLVAGG